MGCGASFVQGYVFRSVVHTFLLADHCPVPVTSVGALIAWGAACANFALQYEGGYISSPGGCVGGGVCAGCPDLQEERSDPQPPLRSPFTNLVAGCGWHRWAGATCFECPFVRSSLLTATQSLRRLSVFQQLWGQRVQIVPSSLRVVACSPLMSFLFHVICHIHCLAPCAA